MEVSNVQTKQLGMHSYTLCSQFGFFEQTSSWTLTSKPVNTFDPSCTLTRCNQFCAGKINQKHKDVTWYHHR